MKKKFDRESTVRSSVKSVEKWVSEDGLQAERRAFYKGKRVSYIGNRKGVGFKTQGAQTAYDQQKRPTATRTWAISQPEKTGQGTHAPRQSDRSSNL